MIGRGRPRRRPSRLHAILARIGRAGAVGVTLGVALLWTLARRFGLLDGPQGPRQSGRPGMPRPAATDRLRDLPDAARDLVEEAVRQRTRELVANEAGFRAFFDHAEDSLVEVEVTRDGRFLCRNINPHAEKVMGVRAASVIGLSAPGILGEQAGERLTAAMMRCVAEGRVRYEETWSTVLGPRVTDTIMVALHGEGEDADRVVRILCSMRDITERRELEAQLAQGQKLQALGQLAGGIAHDFNNVLQAIEGSASVIEQHPDGENVQRLARIMLDAAGRGAAITRRLLAFARRDDLRAEAVSVAGLFENLRAVLGPTIGAAIEVRTEAAPDLPPLLADKGQLEAVLVNLATNARDAMPQGGTLTLSADAVTVAEAETHPAGVCPGRYVRLRVTDTGMGMDAATLARATEPFFTTKPVGKGTGLGLAMARGFAEQSDGALGIRSRAGEGTTISLWLPLAAAESGAASPGGADEAAPAAWTDDAPCILVVDDDALVRETLTLALDEAGCRVQEAADAAGALARLASGERVDLLLSDFSMPGMDGATLIREAQRQRPGLAAILVTGYAGDEAALPGGDAAARSFALLRKPLRASELLARVRAALAPARREPEGGRPGMRPPLSVGSAGGSIAG